MGCISGPELAAAVSNAGGLGFLGVAPMTPEEAEIAIKETKRLTDKPFGIDFGVMRFFGSEEFETEKVLEKVPAEHKEFMNKIKAEWGIPLKKRKVRPFTTPQIIERLVELTISEKIPVFASAVGNPAWAVPALHEAGIKVIAPVGNVKQARAVAHTEKLNGIK